MKAKPIETPTIQANLSKSAKFPLGWLLYVVLMLPVSPVYAQNVQDQISIDANGIMRWRENGKEVEGFGVNYTVPFAHSYRSGKKLGIDLKKAIDQDVSHFERLGFDLFRVHVWDCEISDTLGNVLGNEHLELFDYLLSRLKEKKINAIITPIAYWGNGWPDKDEPTPGFSHKYGKEGCLTNPAAIAAQENYLAQFINHVNRYTGVPYKDEPGILAFEISNEPHHKGSAEEVTVFIKKMLNSIRSTKCTKPVFYNVTHSIHLAEAYYAAGIDGGTFQWYPTGLGFQKELGGNMLPNVDRYTIPFDGMMKKNHSARIVYEFDAADMASSYMYPAMARSFRTSGMQLATHFSYDPTYLSPYNTEYNTHYMNLLYAPRKALALMICAEIFRTIPLYTDYGNYPANTSFGPFHISYENDLAEMITEEKFIYTNHTTARPEHLDKLKLIAGWGNSPLVEYAGSGAYFLDKVGEKIWRLEVMPDAIQIDNLFGQNSLDKTLAMLKEEKHKIKINLPEFLDGMVMESVDWRDSIVYQEIRKNHVDVKPGIYLLMHSDYRDANVVDLQSNKQIDWEATAPLPPASLNNAAPYISARIRPKSYTLPNKEAISLFDASLDFQWLNRKWVGGFDLKHDEQTNESYVHIPLKGLTEIDVENLNGPMIASYALGHYFGDIIAYKKSSISQKKTLVFQGFAEGDASYPIQLSLVMKDGSAFGGLIYLKPGINQYPIELNALERIKPVQLPRPYPTFLPYYSDAGIAKVLDLNQIEKLQIIIGPGISKGDWDKPYTLNIQNVWLE